MSDYLRRPLKRSDSNEYINDFTDVSEDLAYCDKCDRRLTKYNDTKLVCNYCQIITDINFTLVKRKARQGPIDDDVDYGNELSIFSEYYNFQTRKEEKDPYIDSLKARGYQIISSSKK